MNLKEVYEIFYPGKKQNRFSVWKETPKYRSKKEFFESVIPMELRWINSKLWNDKARRSRFLSDSRMEQGYLLLLKDFILEKPMVISRIESKGQEMLREQLSVEYMNQMFQQIVQREHIHFSPMLQHYLMEIEGQFLVRDWGRMLAFLILYAIFPEQVHQFYVPYLQEREYVILPTKKEQDVSLFQYEYPPDMSVHEPGERMRHTWVLKNVGKVIWEGRYLECDTSADWLPEESRRIPLPETVYPGDSVWPTVELQVPDIPGNYALNWKMKDQEGATLFSCKVGIGLHFTVLEPWEKELENKDNNYQIVKEEPNIPVVMIAGKIHEHRWIIENTGTVIWENYYCECMNGESFGYTRNELRVYLKQKVKPGETVTVQIEFAVPPIEGSCCLIWKLMDKNGKPAFASGRKMEVLLHLL